MRVLRTVDYPVLLWKNGGGLTREILKVPGDGAVFDWRLSLATIDVPGPFSSFEDYDRTLVLVDGGGVRLDFGSQGQAVLRTPGESVAFDGAWPTRCALIAGRSTDLNLIVAKTRARAQSRVLSVTTPETIGTAGWEETLVCCLHGALHIDSQAGGHARLSPLDVARCAPEDGPLTCSSDSTPALIFAATVRHRSP